MFNTKAFNTVSYNHYELIIAAKLGGFSYTGHVPTFTFISITVSVPLAGMAIDGLAAGTTGDITISVPLANMAVEQLGIDLVQILAHYISNPRYLSLGKAVNRVYIVGSDDDGNMVFGEAKDSSINGEILRVFPESMITSSATANTVATNILNSERLNAQRGEISVAPNCGMEVWDTIQITDSVCNQSTNYRVAGWTFYYSPYIPNLKEAVYRHVIKLTSV